MKPTSNTWENTLNVNFTFNATTDDKIANCSLWTNETSWSLGQSNDTIISNNTVYGIDFTFSSEGDYLWNIECIDIY